MDRAILLDISEPHLDNPPGSAAYSFADVDAMALPEGDHQLVGTVNGTPVYLADKCLDVSEIDVDGQTAFSTGGITLWDNEYSGTTWKDMQLGSGNDFQGFDASDLGQFIEDNHARMVDQNEEMTHENCMVLSVAEPEIATVPGEPAPDVTMKI